MLSGPYARLILLLEDRSSILRKVTMADKMFFGHLGAADWVKQNPHRSVAVVKIRKDDTKSNEVTTSLTLEIADRVRFVGAPDQPFELRFGNADHPIMRDEWGVPREVVDIVLDILEIFPRRLI